MHQAAVASGRNPGRTSPYARPVHRTIPHGSIHSSKLEHGRADTSVGAHNGSNLFRLNKWTTTWGSEGALH